MTRTSVSSRERMELNAALARNGWMPGPHAARSDGMGRWPSPEAVREALILDGRHLASAENGMNFLLAGLSDGTEAGAARTIFGKRLPLGDVTVAACNRFLETRAVESSPGGMVFRLGSGTFDEYHVQSTLPAIVSMLGRGVDEDAIGDFIHVSFPLHEAGWRTMMPPTMAEATRASEGEGFDVIERTYRSLGALVPADGHFRERWSGAGSMRAIIAREDRLFDVPYIIACGCLFHPGGPKPEEGTAWDAGIALAHADYMKPGFMDGPVSSGEDDVMGMLRAAKPGSQGMLMRLYRLMSSGDKARERWIMRLTARILEIIRPAGGDESPAGMLRAERLVFSYPDLADELEAGYPSGFILENVRTYAAAAGGADVRDIARHG